ncbi:c-type cytochrome [Wenzhouxiangella limi]|uniref:C-type cytochrome n=1 Tax=Wenzhouxiangella limi TaxID=2707351 RepID=A0A845UYW4_9GAMM|nr:cytochrome c [Wenzhouxiangella limi]NDY95080.1 c-type cytochrome [Wenzhouxiangella limi]
MSKYFLPIAIACGLALVLSGCARTPESQMTTMADPDCQPDPATPQAPADIRSLNNPLDMTPDQLAAGRDLYQDSARPVACAQCHGKQGDGTGPLGRHLDPSPPDLTCDFYRDIPDGQLFWITREGSNFMSNEPGHTDVRRPGRRDRASAMRPHRYFLTEEETWQVIGYMRTFHSE